jgi:DNA repair protein RadC
MGCASVSKLSKGDESKTMNTPFKTAQQKGLYTVLRPITADEILAMARALIRRRFQRGKALTSPDASRELLILNLALLERETFCCLFFDNRHRVLAFETLFKGTIDGTPVYPREVVKRALQLNANALIFAHNHPSGNVEPSDADAWITRKLVNALRLVDVRVLDHFIIGAVRFFR